MKTVIALIVICSVVGFSQVGNPKIFVDLDQMKQFIPQDQYEAATKTGSFGTVAREVEKFNQTNGTAWKIVDAREDANIVLSFSVKRTFLMTSVGCDTFIRKPDGSLALHESISAPTFDAVVRRAIWGNRKPGKKKAR